MSSSAPSILLSFFVAPLRLPTERFIIQLCLWYHSHAIEGFPGGANGKEPTCQCKRHKRHGFYSWMGKIPWSRKWKSTPESLPVKFHRQRRATVHGVIKSWTQLSTTPHAIGIVRFLLSLSFCKNVFYEFFLPCFPYRSFWSLGEDFRAKPLPHLNHKQNCYESGLNDCTHTKK